MWHRLVPHGWWHITHNSHHPSFFKQGMKEAFGMSVIGGGIRSGKLVGNPILGIENSHKIRRKFPIISNQVCEAMAGLIWTAAC